MSSGLKDTLVGLACVTVVFLGAVFWVDSFIASGVEGVGTELTGTQVTVEGASVSPLSGSGTISGFRVANPEGYEKGHAVVADEISVELEVSTLLSDPIVVEKVTVENPALNLARQGTEVNLRAILQNVNRAADESPSSGSTMVIEHFLVKNGAIDVYVNVGRERSARKDLPRIELRDLGRDEGGLPARQIVQAVANRIVGVTLETGGGNWMDRARDAIKDLFD